MASFLVEELPDEGGSDDLDHKWWVVVKTKADEEEGNDEAWKKHPLVVWEEIPSELMLIM